MNFKNNHSYFAALCFVVIQGISSLCFAQTEAVKDSTSIISYSDKIILKVNLDTHENTYLVNDRIDNTTTTIATNNSFGLFLSLDYDFIGVSIGFAPKFLPGNDDDYLKGKSSYSDLGFRFFLDKWSQKVFYRKIKGYYIDNTQDFLTGWNEGTDPYIQFPNLQSKQWGGSTSYILNDQFSLRNLVYQTEWQRKSAGSFIPKLEYTYGKLSNSGENYIDASENIFDIKLAASYYYTWVIHNNWFASGFLSPALGMRYSNAKSSENGITIKEKNNHLIKTIESGLQLGYSSEHIIFGVNFNLYSNYYNEDKTTYIVDDTFYAKVYFGYRLDAPKFLTRLNDKYFDNFEL